MEQEEEWMEETKKDEEIGDTEDDSQLGYAVKQYVGSEIYELVK